MRAAAPPLFEQSGFCNEQGTSQGDHHGAPLVPLDDGVCLRDFLHVSVWFSDGAGTRLWSVEWRGRLPGPECSKFQRAEEHQPERLAAAALRSADGAV